jgi:hypothetical protein
MTHLDPPGFVLKSEKKAAEELAKKDQISLEDFLEVEVSHAILLRLHDETRRKSVAVHALVTCCELGSLDVWVRFRSPPLDKCMYRHALPPGFVLKSEKKAAEELAKKDQISLEDFLEVEVDVWVRFRSPPLG